MANEIIEVKLQRQKQYKTATVGTLHICTKNLVWSCKTLELPWKNNIPNESCIPVGTYRCERVKSEKFGETFILTDVPGRSGILFHCGNTVPKDTRGCILIGVGLDCTDRKPVLLASRAAMNTFRDMLSGFDSFNLVIEGIG